ncbi:MinD/ParA family protein [Pontiella agarivorans]|uniref:MinD/ParA family protein n=1 Tax=Pontiella agarivorans TaxID=3038953 RepID=A0ABU5MSX5_9BACT|nr:MinD/ParA family protein [Pontiella agarivorans]MDZ8117270.1 MinD/ParA family protein [Pontiella agarivorans]
MEPKEQTAEATVSRQLRCLAIGSGKGGVGKTVISVGLSVALVEMGYRVLLFDADLGLANVDLQIGIDPVFTLQDVVYGECPLEQAVASVPGGPDVLAASSGAREMATMSESRREMLVDDLIRFSAGYDFLIIDTEAGIGAGAIAFLQAMPQVNVVVANEPTSVMDAYSLIKILSAEPVPPEIRLVVNSVKTEEEGQRLAMRLNETMKRFLGRTIEIAGIVLYDSVVGDAIRARRSVVHFAPQSAPAIGLRHLAHSIVSSNKARDFGKPMDRSAFGNMATVGQSGAGSEDEK